MIHNRIFLEEGSQEVWLDTYLADPTPGYTRKAILVIPGGGYGTVCSDREGEPIALAFLPHGFNAFVLHYSVAADQRTFPAQLIQASRAMVHIRSHTAEYGIDPQKIFVTGFSAGGHLTASLGILWHHKAVTETLDIPFGYNKPNGIIPVYPVISGVSEHRHLGSFQNLLGAEEPTRKQLEAVSLELQVDSRSAPAFIVHTANDTLVPVQNSLLLADAYARAGVPFELHVWPDSPHGVALGNAITACGDSNWIRPRIARWVAEAAAWTDEI